MENSAGTDQKAKSVWQGILDTVLAVIKDPAGFYRGMPRSGGFGDPLVFVVVLGVIGGLVRAILGLFHLGAVVSTAMALAAIVVTPILVIIGSFIGAAILFVI